MVTSAGWHKVYQGTLLTIDSGSFAVKGFPFNRRQLIPTASGVKRIAGIYADYYPTGSTTAVNYASMYRDAGVPRALEPRCRNAVAGGATDHGLIALTGFEWLLLSSAAAYRIAWFKRDENGVPAISAPSGRVVVRNTSTTTNYATRLKVVVPSGVTDSSYVMQIYRTNIIQIDGLGVIPDPGDDMFLAGEYRLTSTDLSNGYVLYEDVSIDGLLGDALYTNETQEGAVGSRMKPPLCRDIASFGGCAFYSNVTERQRLTIKLLAVDSSGIGTYKGVTVGDKIVAGDLTMEAVALANEEVQQWHFATDATTGVGSEVIRAMKTAESFVYKYNIWSNAKNGRYAAYNLTTNNDVVGVIGLEEKSVGGTTGAYLGVNRVDAPVQILPAPVFTSTPSNTLAQACAVVTDIGPTTVTVTAAANHNLTTNDLVFLAPFAASTESGTSSPRLVNTDVPSGVYKVTVTGATTFTFPSPAGAASNQTDARAATTGGYFHKIFDTTSSIWTEARSKNSRVPNRLMWSAPFEPECAPILNFADLGDASKAILRMVPTQDSLFIFKEDGTWRLKGDAGDWEIIVLDKNCVLAANESPAVVDGRVYAFTTNGVSAIDDGGTSVVSGDISGTFSLYRTFATYPTTSVGYIGCGHSEQKAYWICFRSLDDIWRYHVPTKTWSQHYFTTAGSTSDPALVTTNGEPYCIATVKASRYTTFDNQAYSERLVGAFIDDLSTERVMIERRNGRQIDYCDADIPVAVSSFDTTNKTVTLAPAPTNTEIGDVFIWYNNTTGKYPPGGYNYSSTVDSSSLGGKYRAVVTAINGNVLTLAISGAVPALSSWPAVAGTRSGAILKNIRTAIVPMPILIDDGMSLGHFSEVVLSIGSLGRFSYIGVGFSTEVYGGVASTGYYTDQSSSAVNGFAYADWNLISSSHVESVLGQIKTFRSGVPRASSAGSVMIVAVRHAVACEEFNFAGLRLIYTEGDNKTRKTNA